MIALSDSIMFWLIWIEMDICTLELNKILTYSLFFSLDDEYLLKVTRFMAFLVNLSLVFCYILSLNLNICVCIDLILMIKNPWSKQKSRMKPYFRFSMLVAVAAVTMETLL